MRSATIERAKKEAPKWPGHASEVGQLDLGHAAVYEELDAGDKAAVIGGEEGNGFGDFVGCAEAAQGDTTHHGSFELGSLLGIRA